jgi:predicted transcriptional regulator
MSDVFDRLKKKGARPTVPARDTSLVKKENTEILNDEITEISHSVNTKEQNPVNADVIEDSTSVSPQELQRDLPQTVRRTIRLEEEVDSKLDTLCNTQKITRDNFIEAAFMVCSQNEELMQEVLKEAKQRYQQRKQLGEQRKFQTMVKKMNPPNLT